jgi:hypothetical protein
MMLWMVPPSTACLQGSVFVSFTVDPRNDGSMSSVIPEEGPGESIQDRREENLFTALED